MLLFYIELECTYWQRIISAKMKSDKSKYSRGKSRLSERYAEKRPCGKKTLWKKGLVEKRPCGKKA